MGMPEPTVEEIAMALHGNKNSIERAVISVCQQYMEGEEHLALFVDEAESFYDMMKGKSDKDLLETWSHRRAMVAHCDQNLNID